MRSVWKTSSHKASGPALYKIPQHISNLTWCCDDTWFNDHVPPFHRWYWLPLGDYQENFDLTFCFILFTRSRPMLRGYHIRSYSILADVIVVPFILTGRYWTSWADRWPILKKRGRTMCLEETALRPWKAIPYNDNVVERIEQTATWRLYDQATMRLALKGSAVNAYLHHASHGESKQ